VAPKAKAADKSNVTVSTKTPPVTADQSGAAAAPAVAGSGLYIQVGLFGVVQNADGAIGQLHALGLPVARGAMRKQGKSLVVVMVGPLASLGQAQQALSATQSAGFTDAYIR
jgi:cell division protein FtsN